VILPNFIEAAGAARSGVMAGVADARPFRAQSLVMSQNGILASVWLRTLGTV
jgi:hypothetical protein